MADGVVWAPSTQKEIAYYDKLFGVIDRDKTGTLDGKETVQFLSLSGLSKAQLKNVWSVAISPGQAVLQRQDFYVAMRAVSMAQSGEVKISRERVRETATNPIGVSTFKGMPAPPFKLSKGKKQQAMKSPTPKEEPKHPSKEKTATAKAVATAQKPTTKRAPKNVAKKRDSAFDRKNDSASDDPSATVHNEGKRVAKDSGKGRNKGLKNDERSPPATSKIVERGSSGGASSSSSSGADSESGGDEDDTSCSGGERANDDGDRNDGSRACRDKSGEPISDNEDASGTESSDGDSSDEYRVERKGHDGDDNTKEPERSGRSRSSRSSSSLNDFSSKSSGDDDDESASVAGSKNIPDAVGKCKKISSDRPRSLSGSSSSSSSPSCEGEDESPDPFSMSEKARARYKAIFSKVDAVGTGSLSGKQVIELFAKSGLDKAVLAIIWRLSDLDEDGSLSPQEFGIAFHLIFCATQRGLDVPDELPQSLWPDGYVPPSILARREADAKRKRKDEEEERRRRQNLGDRQTGTAGEASADAAAVMGTAKEKKKKRGKKMAACEKAGDKATSATSSNKKTSVEEEEEQRKETAAREAASRQKKEELAKKRSDRAAKRKNNKRRPRKSPLDAAQANVGTSTSSAGDVLSTAAAPTSSAAEDAAAKQLQDKGTTKADGAAATTSPRSDASDPPSIGGEDVVEIDKSEATKRTKKKKRERPSSALVSSMGETPDVDSDNNGRKNRVMREPAAAVSPLTMAERRARKAEARAARIETALLKKEAAARDARLKELDLQDDSKKFTMKAMDPMTRSEDNGALHMLSDLGEDSGGALSFAHLSAPLPHLTPCPGHPPCLRLQEFSVSFPSGVRRASSLTSSLELRLGPPKEPLHPAARDEDSKGCDKGTSDDHLLRCPECAEFLTEGQMVQHIRSTCRLRPCALCLCLLLPADRERHLEEVCPNRRRGCARCGVDVILSEFARHEKQGGCERRTVRCVACGEYCCADDLRGHQRTSCPERDVRCPSCGDVLPARCVEEHASSLCRSISWTCGCGEGPIPMASRPRHLKSCDAFIDAWEASIEQVITGTPKIEVVRNIGKVMISTRVEDPGIALLALAECGGKVSIAARKVTDDRAYVKELCLTADIVNVGLFLKVLKKPGKRGSGALWRAGL